MAIAEIADQIGRSTRCSHRDAVSRADQSRVAIDGLSRVTADIGDHRLGDRRHRRPDQSPRPQRDDRSGAGGRRRPRLRRGSPPEVKGLAGQTAQARPKKSAGKVAEIQAATKPRRRARSAAVTEQISTLDGVSSAIAAAMEEQRTAMNSFSAVDRTAPTPRSTTWRDGCSTSPSGSTGIRPTSAERVTAGLRRHAARSSERVRSPRSRRSSRPPPARRNGAARPTAGRARRRSPCRSRSTGGPSRTTDRPRSRATARGWRRFRRSQPRAARLALVDRGTQAIEAPPCVWAEREGSGRAVRPARSRQALVERLGETMVSRGRNASASAPPDVTGIALASRRRSNGISEGASQSFDAWTANPELQYPATSGSIESGSPSGNRLGGDGFDEGNEARTRNDRARPHHRRRSKRAFGATATRALLSASLLLLIGP